MKRKDIAMLAAVAAITGIISLIISSIFFSVPKNRSSKVPAVETITTSFPDVKNDPAYQSFLNAGALNPAQPVQIGDTQNTTPFSNRGQ